MTNDFAKPKSSKLKQFGLGALGCFGLIFVGLFALAIILPDPPTKKADAVKAATPARVDPAAAKTALINFYSTISKAGKPCERAVELVQAEVSGGDKVSAYESARAGQAECRSVASGILALAVPVELQGDARGAAVRGQLRCTTAFNTTASALEQLQVVLDGDVRASTLSSYRSTVDEGNRAQLACAAAFFEAGTALGMKPDDLTKATR